MSSLMPDCTLKCRSLQHALDIVSVVTRGSEGQIKAFLTSHCYNAATSKDMFGRSALHLASSCGKKGVLDWLAETNGVDLSAKDKESGWTALHRGVFYGHIDCAWSLLKHGVNLYVPDKEGLSALDLVMKDRPTHVVFKNTDPTDVYTWGNNVNFTLGHGSQQSKHHPELVDLFPRNGVYIKQIPRLVESLIVHQCSQIAAAKDHTVVLTEDGYVYTFGLNTFHQLGIVPPPTNCNVPRQVQAKNLKGRTVLGVAAGRFHTVLWTKEAVYTMGLNGGQLGYLPDPNGEKCVTSPRQVSALHHKDITISFVTASDGATVCVTERGDIYLLTEYQCKKIASKQLNLKKVLVSGGYLDYRVAPQHLKENEGQRTSILALDQAGRSPSDDVASYDTKNVYERIRLEKLAFVHRAVSVTTDPNGSNFAVLQSDPKTSLYEIPSVSTSSFTEDFSKLLGEAEVMDIIHDATLQVGTRIFPVHKYILAMRSDFFRKLFDSDHDWFDSADIYRKDEDDVGCDLFVIEKLHPDLLMYLLQYIYTDSCDLLIHGHRPKMVYKEKMEESQDCLTTNLNKITISEDVNNKSAFEVYRSNQVHMVNEKQKSKSKSASKKCKSVREEVNLIKMLQVAAKKFGLGNLSSRLDGVRMENGKIYIVNRKNGNKPKLNQKKLSYLCDVTMKSIDGKEFPCHKCVLCARLDYFHSMLSSSWIEASHCAALEMPFHSDILQVILDYIYTDEALAIKESQNVEFVCNVLVVADQLLMSRLKEICEGVITEKLTLRNAAELLEFAAMYNAEQLKQSCSQFIVLNMAALLETRALDVLSDDVLKDLSVSYRNMIPAMVRRVITPYQGGPDISSLEPEEGETFVFLKEELNTEQATHRPIPHGSKLSQKQRKLIAMAAKDNCPEITPEAAMQPPTPPKATMLGNVWSVLVLERNFRDEKDLAQCEIPRGSIGEVFSPKESGDIYVTSCPICIHLPLSGEGASSLHSAVPKSFRDLLAGEEKFVSMGTSSRKVSVKGSEDAQSQKSPRGTTASNLRADTDHSCEPTQLESQNPWLSASSMSPAAATPITFAEIVEEELQQEAALIRSREKPLALIQIEERAIQDLLIHYQALDNPDEFVVVERSPQGPIAAPMWNKH
ncbi:hypothetical protein lerEdw1_001296 [Lerista edwardsae]|nr:hypothetical protein lerEdw1_001296 [Lerista edwardsae]